MVKRTVAMIEIEDLEKTWMLLMDNFRKKLKRESKTKKEEIKEIEETEEILCEIDKIFWEIKREEEKEKRIVAKVVEKKTGDEAKNDKTQG